MYKSLFAYCIANLWTNISLFTFVRFANTLGAASIDARPLGVDTHISGTTVYIVYWKLFGQNIPVWLSCVILELKLD